MSALTLSADVIIIGTDSNHLKPQSRSKRYWTEHHLRSIS